MLESKESNTINWFVYILECSDGTFYTGVTNDLRKRLEAHNRGQGAKYTRGRLPVKLVYFEEFNSKSEAMSCEFYLKKKSRLAKMELIDSANIEIS